MPAASFWSYLALFGLSYLLGSVSASYLAVKAFRRQDLRYEGTGNLGARNAGRLLGWPGFALVFAGDAAKGLLAVRLAQAWLGNDLAALTAALAVLLGHSYSIFLGFSGGKGLASAVGVLLALSPLVALVMLLLAALFLLLTRQVYLAPVLAAVCFPAVAWFFWRSPVWSLGGWLLVALILWRHRRNLADKNRARARAIPPTPAPTAPPAAADPPGEPPRR